MSRSSDHGAAAPDDVVIRRAVDRDAPGIAEVSLDSFRATYHFPGAHTDDEVRRWVREVVVPAKETWVAVDADGSIAGFMALEDDLVDQLYLRPGRTGHGIGARFLHLAMTRRPAGLSLYTFQANSGARRFYERHGFVAVALGDGSGNDEGQPDVRYEWQPGGSPGADVAETTSGTWTTGGGTGARSSRS